jgi:4-hydroxymandelate oxidase
MGASAAAPTCSRPWPLGAHAVLIGRPAVFGLANAGAHGVAHVLRLLRDELEIAMALTGCRTLADVSREVLLHPATEQLHN